jgi:hypothetical protein
MVLTKVPNARLIIAGANHHTRAGYWESIREAQPTNLPIEFRGYVPEEDIPELFRTATILALPYDSATGSSGPAHQACEYGVPIVCADIADLRGMALDEDMAVRFYKTGDADDLAVQLIDILQSPELQHQMANYNFAAGVEMAMNRVVSNYLRWFTLNKFKRALGDTRSPLARHNPLSDTQRDHKALADRCLDTALWTERGDSLNTGYSLGPVRLFTRLGAFVDAFVWRQSKASQGRLESDGKHPNPAPEAAHD